MTSGNVADRARAIGLPVTEIDGNEIVEEIRKRKARDTRDQIYFRVKVSIAKDFKEKCKEKKLNYNEVLEALMERFTGTVTPGE